MSKQQTVLSRALDLIPDYRQPAAKAKPRTFKDENGIRFDKLGNMSGIARREITRALNIRAINNITRMLRNSFKQKITHEDLILFYCNQKPIGKVINELAEILLIRELEICRREKIGLLHSGYSSIDQLKRSYPYLTKYTRFSYLRNTIVKPALEKHKKEFNAFNTIFPVNEMLAIYKDNQDRQYMKNDYQYMHVLQIFRIWLRYKSSTKVNHELDRLKEYLSREHYFYNPYWLWNDR